MTKAVRYIIFPLIIWAYLFGSSGFIVHNCYMSDSCFVSNSILNAWNNFMFSDCDYSQPSEESEQEENNQESFPIFDQAKGQCTESVHTLDSYQYQNQSNTDIQHLTASTDFRSQNDLLNLILEDNHYPLYGTNQSLYSVRCSLDKLCIFLI